MSALTVNNSETLCGTFQNTFSVKELIRFHIKLELKKQKIEIFSKFTQRKFNVTEMKNIRTLYTIKSEYKLANSMDISS